MASRLLLSIFLSASLVAALGCEREGEIVPFDGELMGLAAYCEADVDGVGIIDVETDYLPHVVACENGGADFEALKAQVVAARTYLYYKLDSSGSIGDGTSDQVYSCANAPQDEHYAAVEETSGQVLTYDGYTICAFYVAGAIPSNDDCVAVAGDDDYSGTEHYVTYNWGLSGDDIEQTTLGWVDPGNVYNRGCKSQNGADCLSTEGWYHDEILQFYYGMDIVIETAEGDCVEIPDGGPDTDTDIDTDTDTDADTDSDSDTDSDTDSDSDSDDSDDDDCDDECPPCDSGGCSFVPGGESREFLTLIAELV